ncbi:hypothetical protein ACFFKE_24550 [Streptomyces mutabilis]|uniref:hypothetical protein n=1 Tax=Streptomyces mutabilis TaxID=67332 RepID=UPI002795875A|nr:hypothetical protein [Streptomyces mutabilis]
MPISRGAERRLASPCDVLGRLDDNPRLLATVRHGGPLRVERVDAQRAAPPIATTLR